MIEIWKSIGAAGYEVSSYGRVRSYWSVGPSPKILNQYHFLRPAIDNVGYMRVTVCSNGKKYDTHVHRLVLMAFCGPCPHGQEACHFDGDRTNARLDNLRWDTRKNNHSDAIRHGTHTSLFQAGERGSNTKLTLQQVREIRSRISIGQMCKDIAPLYGVKPGTISHIKNGTTWTGIA